VTEPAVPTQGIVSSATAQVARTEKPYARRNVGVSVTEVTNSVSYSVVIAQQPTHPQSRILRTDIDWAICSPSPRQSERPAYGRGLQEATHKDGSTCVPEFAAPPHALMMLVRAGPSAVKPG
jgi:hypothetical protein